MENCNLAEKLGVSEDELKAFFRLFWHFYSEPQGHKAYTKGEFESFVVGFKLAMIQAQVMVEEVARIVGGQNNVMEEHTCRTCGKTFPECGRGRRCVDGYCVRWEAKKQ